jgi:hypothetical protein
VTIRVKFKCHRARSDGCKAQYKCADHFYYVSRQQSEGKPRLDWCFSCSCHGKDLVDPENGGGKRMARRHEDEVGENDEASLRTSYELYKFLKKEYNKPNVDFLDKKMKGIYQREIWYIPATGEGSVNRRIKHCDTLDGSSKLHQFEDIGITGFLRVRERSCHRRNECWQGRSEFCTCVDMKQYPSMLVELKPLTTPERALTRSKLSEEGITMGREVMEGDYVCVEVDNLQEPWMVGRVRTSCEVWPESKGRQYLWMGWVVPGDEVVWVQKLEGVGNTFTLTSKEFPVFIEDIRLMKFKMEKIQTRASSRFNIRGLERFKMCAQTKATIIGSMPMALDP